MARDQKLLALPSADAAGIPTTVERIAFYQAPPSEPEESASNVTFAHYLWMLSRHKWRLLIFVAIAVAATIIVSSRLTKYYESTATIDVDRMMPSGVIGQDANTSRAQYNDSDFFLSTQMKLIQSDSVLRPVARKLKIMPAEKEKDGSSRAEEAPVRLPRLAVARPAKTYLLQISYRSPNPEFAAEVANEVARSYISHSYAIRFQASTMQSEFMTRQLEELRAKMERSSAALAQFEKELNVISPEEKTNILSARLLQLNTDYTNAQGDRLKKEAAATSVKNGSAEALEASAQGEQIRKLADRIDEEAEKFAAVKTQYLPNHPEYRKSATKQAELQRQFEALKANVAMRVDVEYIEAVNRERMAKGAVDEVKAEFDHLNSKSIEYKALKHDADSDRAVLDDLTRKIKEAAINAGFQSSSIRLADPARPSLTPVYPNIRVNAILAFLASLILGIGVIFVSENLDHTLRDPEQITRQLQTEVLGALPVVKAWRGHLPAAPGSETDASKRREFFGSAGGIANTYEEAVRTLRDSILLPNAEKRPRSLLITSATPREGKTTTAVHLAVVHSQQKRRTLIIDSDLRRPGVYQHVGVSNDRGLSNVVNGEFAWRDLLLNPAGLPHLQVLPAGPPSRRAADGIGETLRHLLADAVKDYDLIICDAPPLLGFAESLQIASLVDGVVVVALAGQTERNAVASVLNNLKRLKANVIGLALNEVRSDMSERYYYYGYYGKYYSRYYKPLSN